MPQQMRRLALRLHDLIASRSGAIGQQCTKTHDKGILQAAQHAMILPEPLAIQPVATSSATGPSTMTAIRTQPACMHKWASTACAVPAHTGQAHLHSGLNQMRGYSSSSPTEPPSDASTPQGGGQAAASKELRMSLQEALMKLVDAAVEMVEAGNTDDAISVLKEGIATFEPNFPDSPELGELHNQVALLSLVSGDADSAAAHAATALAITRKHFSGGGPLVGHRQLRLGVATFAQGKLTDAAELLQGAREALTTANDPSRFEADYYLALSLLAGTRDVAQVAQVEGRLLSDLKSMKDVFGAESMIVSLALAQHDRIAHQPLAAAEPDNMLCENLLKQHARLLEFVNPEGEDLAVAHYKLATFYYVHDMLDDAQNYVRRAGSSLRALMPEEHDLVAMCKHRLGMICAVLGDHRAAEQLLSASLKRYGGETEDGSSSSDGGAGAEGPVGAMSGLALEAKLGLAIAKYRALPATATPEAKQLAQGGIRARLDTLAAAIGIQHMLVRGALRHVARMGIRA